MNGLIVEGIYLKATGYNQRLSKLPTKIPMHHSPSFSKSKEKIIQKQKSRKYPDVSGKYFMGSRDQLYKMIEYLLLGVAHFTAPIWTIFLLPPLILNLWL